MPTAVKSWKFLRLDEGDIASAHGLQGWYRKDRTVWKVGEWKHQSGNISPCYRGFHHSNNPLDAFSYVQGEVLARVEVKGTRVESLDGDPTHKEAVSDMRIIRAGLWGKGDSVNLALFAARCAAAEVPETHDVRKLAERGLSAVRDYLLTGAQVPQSLKNELTNASYGRVRVGPGDAADVLYSAYYATLTTDTDCDQTDAAYNAIYAVGSARNVIDGYGRIGTGLKASVNDWMETRFKTLPRL